ncbi:MAG: hypothetical protein ACHQCF_06760 [Solirubrobacterales bacterium]
MWKIWRYSKKGKLITGAITALAAAVSGGIFLLTGSGPVALLAFIGAGFAITVGMRVWYRWKHPERPIGRFPLVFWAGWPVMGASAFASATGHTIAGVFGWVIGVLLFTIGSRRYQRPASG